MGVLQQCQKCPKCGSIELEHFSSDVIDDMLALPYECLYCGYFGYLEYKFVSVENKDGVKDKSNLLNMSIQSGYCASCGSKDSDIKYINSEICNDGLLKLTYVCEDCNFEGHEFHCINGKSEIM